MLLVGGLSTIGCATVPSAAPAPAPASAQAGGATIVAVAAPSPPPVTLPQFLGLDLVFGGAQKATLCVRNRLGSRFPGLEPKPPIKSITDPANMEPGASPAVQAAAKAKVEADKAPQKAKAIRYLASQGCGECYPDTEDALLAALEDCSEQIRYEVVRGLQSSVGGCCQSCKENSCCTPKLLKKLYQVAYDRDDAGCFVESSARIRRNARLVICKCGGVPSEMENGVPIEGPGEQLLIDGSAEPADASLSSVIEREEGVDLEVVAQGLSAQVASLEQAVGRDALSQGPGITRDAIGSGLGHQESDLGRQGFPGTIQAKPVGFVMPQ
ncbi:hypothetical protein [Rhodopirellula sp. MGV]|uniref:hypothetical protein n=1 Tax=Rhodopirellula sp. MGV TaxID=2023130 RepID=UPI001179A71A|nr:hypothetical protein [Rhodopirellula sp. MGV]